MKKFTNIILLLTALVITVLFFVIFSSEWNRAAFGSKGYIDRGTKFGIEISSSRDDAINKLNEFGLESKKPAYPNKCYGRTYDETVELDLLIDDSWRRGTICIGSVSGKITSVSWFYGVFQP